MGPMSYWWWKPWYYSWWGPFCFPLLLILAGICLFLFFRRSPHTDAAAGAGLPRPRREPQVSPLDIVNQRYARGELSREEFERLKQDLAG